MENASFFLLPNSNTSVPVSCAGIILSIIVLGVSLPLNIYVLWLFAISVRNALSEVTSVFSFNLCACEIFICFNILFALFYLTPYKNELTVNFYYFMQFLSMMHNISRPFFQCCVCVERYMAVIYPVIFLKYKPLRYRTALSLVAWTITLVLSVFCLFLSLRNIMYYILLPEYILVVSIVIFCSVVVLKALRKPRPGEKLSEKDAESNRMKKKAFWLIMIHLGCICFTYSPMIMLVFLYDYLSYVQQSTCQMVFSFFVIFGGFLAPCLYLHRVGKLTFNSGI